MQCGGSYPAAAHVCFEARAALSIVSARLWLSQRTKIRGRGSSLYEKREPLLETRRKRCGSQVERKARR